MKLKSLPFFLSAFISLNSYSQNNRAIAITGQSSGNYNWVDIREIDLATGTVVKTIFESGKTNFIYTSNFKKDNFNNLEITNVQTSPTQSQVAAAAFDIKNNKLFFMPFKGFELVWLDMNDQNDKLKFYSVQTNLPDINFADEANNITRMTIGSDQYGYAITNDGNHLIQFSTGIKTVIKDLGGLIDANENKSVSIHNKCTSWGGDIVADAYGKLYLFSASNNVFKIDPQNRLATFKGSIKNLPSTYSVNGAAVDTDDQVVVSSANTFEGFYRIDINQLSSTKLPTNGQVFNASDLANGNLLFQNKLINEFQQSALPNTNFSGNDFISIYPNPIIGTEFKVNFDKVKSGKYNLILTDVQGRTILNKEILIKAGSHVELLTLKKKLSGGLYFIKVYDPFNKSVFSDKVMIN